MKRSKSTVLSQRANYVWQLTSMSAYMLSQWLLIVLLARIGSPHEVGLFTLMLAISAPVFLTIGLNLRVVIATDAGGAWRMSEFFALQPIVNFIAGVITLALGAVLGMRNAALVALGMLCLAKAVETRSHIFYGYFQRNRRFDLIAISMFCRAVAGPVGFFCGYWISRTLWVGCLGLALGWISCQVLLDRRNAALLGRHSSILLKSLDGTDYRRLWALTKLAFPLGLDQGVSSLAINTPRYAVQRLMGASALGLYGGVAYLSQAASMVTSSLNVIFVSPLAEYHHAGRRRPFLNALGKIVGLAAIVLIASPAAAWVAGPPLIGFTLGPEYEDRSLLVVLMISAGLTGVQRALCQAVAAARRFKTYLCIDVLTTFVIAVSAPFLVHSYGLEGAAWSMSLGFLAGSFAALVEIMRIVVRMPSRRGRHAELEPRA